jgi:hypothetical protein
MAIDSDANVQGLYVSGKAEVRAGLSASTTADRADATRRLDACSLLRQAEFSRQVVQLGGGARVGR